MTTVEWPSLNEIDGDKLSSARRLAHNAMHWLVRFTSSYGEPELVGNQPPLVWNTRESAIETQRFLDTYSVELRIAPLELQFREDGAHVPHTLGLEEHTPAHVEAWVLVELLHRGIDRSRFSTDLPYSPNDLMTGDHEEYEPKAYARELAAIDQSLRAGATVIEALHRQLSGTAGGTSLSCWPDLFQIGFEIDLPPGSGSKKLRIGIAPGDGVRTEPYFFVGTEQQAQTAGFTRDCVVPLRNAASEGMDAGSAVALLAEIIASQKKRLAG